MKNREVVQLNQSLAKARFISTTTTHPTARHHLSASKVQVLLTEEGMLIIF